MFDTPDDALMDVLDFELIPPLPVTRSEDENLFLAASRTWQQSCQRLFDLLRDAPGVRSGIRQAIAERWSLDAGQCGLYVKDGLRLGLDDAAAFIAQYPDIVLDERCRVYGFPAGHELHDLPPRALLERLKVLDLRERLDQDWQRYWHARAPGTRQSRWNDAARHYRLHLQAAVERSFAAGELGAEWRQILQQLVEGRDNHFVRIPHGRLASGSQQSLPGALVIASDSSLLLYLPSHSPVLQLFSSQDALEQHLVNRQDLLGDDRQPFIGIDHETVAAPLESAFKRLMGSLRTRRLAALADNPLGDLERALDQADRFDIRRASTWLLADAEALASTDSDTDAIAPADSFGGLYRDLPFSARLDKVNRQLSALEVLLEELDGQLPGALQTALDALQDAQAESIDAAAALLATAVPDRTSEHYQTLKQARIAGLRCEADIQQTMKLLDSEQRSLLDAVLRAPLAGQRLDAVVVASLHLHDQQDRHELEGALLIGHATAEGQFSSAQPVLLYWPGAGGGLQGFPSRAAMEREFLKTVPDERTLTLIELHDDPFEHSLARQLSRYEAELRGLDEQGSADSALHALREQTLAHLQVPAHPARDLALQHLAEQHYSATLSHQAPDWLLQLDNGARQQFRQLIERYLVAMQRSRTFLAGALPPRHSFARQQVASRLRQAFDLSEDVQVQLDLPDSVRYAREPIAGSGAPGTPVRLVEIPSAERSRLSLEDLALQQIDPTLEQRLHFMQVLVSGGDDREHPRLLESISLDWLRSTVSELDLAGQYEQRIRDAFMGTADEAPFSAEYREECLREPWRLMLRLQGEAARNQQRLDAQGQRLLEAAIDGDTSTANFSLLPVLLTSGGEDTDGQGAGLSGITLIHQAGTTLLYLPDSPDGRFLRQFDSLEAARRALFRLCFDDPMARYLAQRTLAGDPAAHVARITEACLRQFDGIIAIGLAWPASTSLARHLCDAHMGRLIVAHRSSSRSRYDLFMERYALESGMVFNYIRMALGVVPFVGSLVAVLDGWLAANQAVAAAQRGDVDETLVQLEAVLMCLIDAVMDVLPGVSVNPAALRQATRQRRLLGLARLPSTAAGKGNAVQRFSGYEYPDALSLNGLAPGSEGIYRNVYRHAQGDFILNHGRLYQVGFDQGRHTWRLLGKGAGYRQPIALDETGQWDTHGALFGVNIVSPVAGGGGVLGHLADGLDPLWPAVIRERLPRWWTDPGLRRLRTLRSSTDYQLRELDRLNRETAHEQRLFNRMTDDRQRLHQAEKLANHFAYERHVAEKIYPELEELAQLSAGNNRTRAKDLMSRVAWLQVNRLTNELNGIKRSATEVLDHVDELVADTANTPPTEIAKHLQIMKRRKVLRVQLIGKLQAVANYTHAIELWAKRITNATQKSKVSEDINHALRNFNQSTCDILKVRNYLEVINRYEAATDQSWFYLQIPVARARTEVDRNLNNLFHLPEVRSNAEQRKRMLEACIDSFERYSHNLRAWATSYANYFDHAFVEPLLEHLESISDLAERWKRKIPQPAPKPVNETRRGPSVDRKLFETEDNQFFIGIEEEVAGAERRIIINRINNGTEVYVPGKAGLWRLASAPRTPTPSPPVDINHLLGEARERLDKLSAYKDKVESYARQDMLPRNLEHLMLSEANELRARAERIAEHAPSAEIIATLRRKADGLVDKGRTLRIRQSLASKVPNEGMLDYLMEQKAVDIRKIGGLIQLPKRIEGQPDFLQEFEIRDLTQGTPNAKWYAHFHFHSKNPGFERFTKAHLKTAEQRRLGLQWQLAQGEGAERIWRGDIARPMAKKHFAALFKHSSEQ